jgi:hypothetical protein
MEAYRYNKLLTIDSNEQLFRVLALYLLVWIHQEYNPKHGPAVRIL